MRLGYGRSDKRRRRSERTRHSSSEGRSQAEGRGAYLHRVDIVLVQGQMWEPEPEPHSPDLDTSDTHRAEGMHMRVQACTQPHMDTVHMLAQTFIVDYECVCVCVFRCLTAANKACSVSSRPLCIYVNLTSLAGLSGTPPRVRRT